MNSKTGDAVVFYHEGSVMSWGMGIENAFEQWPAELSVQQNAAGDMALQRIVATDHN